MKKICTIIFLLSATCSFGQKDLAVELRGSNSSFSPEAGKSYNLLYYVRNTGSIKITADDTVFLQIETDGTITGGKQKQLYLDEFMPGDSIFIPFGYHFSKGGTDSIRFCLVLKLNNNGQADDDTSNNTSCAQILVKDIVSGLGETGAANGHTLYPNPTADYVVIENKTDDAAVVEIIDITGRVCITADITGQPVNTSGLVDGVYFCRLLRADKEVLQASRLVISR
jgi:hypothetical protein